ncbi:MAG TPA: SAM-dependent chlorinase/fluorinase [Planctomycetota bacterium]
MKRPLPCIALLTDFGEADPYVGIMKGVILSINPEARIVDVSHAIPPQSVPGAGFHLGSCVPYFPDGTLFVAVVDPGVGTRRKILYGESKRHRFLAPDNGLLSLLDRADRIRSIRAVTARRYMRSEISNTFHGRDIFAPVAAWLSLGIPAERLGPRVRRMKRPDVEAPRPLKNGSIVGQVIAWDRFGNLITDIPASAIRDPKRSVISLAGETITGVSKTYGNGKPGELLAVIGSAGTLEIVRVEGSAGATLFVKPKDRVTVTPAGLDRVDPETQDAVFLVEANLDNVTGESVGDLFERLFACGALDVWTTPIQMKKSRPGVKISVLAPYGEHLRMSRELLRNTPTFGVRWEHVYRLKLARRWRPMRTKYGSIRCKIGYLDGKAIRAAPEYEDVAAAARRAKVPFDTVHLAAAEAGRRLLDK